MYNVVEFMLESSQIVRHLHLRHGCDFSLLTPKEGEEVQQLTR